MNKELLELAEFALSTAAPLVEYVEVRAESETTEALVRADGHCLPPNRSTSWGLAIRIWNGGWGFAATCQQSREAVLKTVELARAMARIKKTELPPTSRIQAQWQSSCLQDPFSLPLPQKQEILGEIEGQLRSCAKVVASKAALIFFQEEQLFLNSTGARIQQRKTESGYSLRVVATDGNHIIVRSAPNCLGGGFAQAGFESILAANLPQRAAEIAHEAGELLSAPPAPRGKLDLILAGNQLALQVHESLGHALELDRAQGTEESLAGGSFLTPDRLGSPIASPLVNVTADATASGAVGSFGFDDEGTAAQAIPLVRGGVAEGYLSSREHNIKGSSGGAMRAASWRDLPLIRMTNVNLEPGEATMAELIRGVELGLLLDTPDSWSIDQRRLNFQFSAEAGYLIQRGKIQGLVRSPVYWGTTPQFWSSCDGISRETQWQTVPNCGKGLPLQVVRVGHRVSPARFRDVAVAFGGRR
jgi:TldD protein